MYLDCLYVNHIDPSNETQIFFSSRSLRGLRIMHIFKSVPYRLLIFCLPSVTVLILLSSLHGMFYTPFNTIPLTVLLHPVCGPPPTHHRACVLIFVLRKTARYKLKSPPSHLDLSQCQHPRAFASLNTMEEFCDIPYVKSSSDGRLHEFDLYVPGTGDTTAPRPLICFVHGGAWRSYVESFIRESG